MGMGNTGHPFEFGQKGQHTRLRFADLHVWTQFLRLPGRQGQVVLAPQIEYRFQAHAAVQVAVQLDQRKIGMDHGALLLTK
jgi:hypothetical protein